MAATRNMPTLQGKSVTDFSGGPNLRDAAPQLAQNELTDAWNITLDERGGAAGRLGYQKYNGVQFNASPVANTFWSSLLGSLITQAGLAIYLGTNTTARHTFTTTETVTFCEMNSRIVACHPTDGLFTSTDAITWTAVADPDAPKGTCVAVFQSKVFVGGPDGSVRWSDATDPTAWTGTSFNKLWEKDQQAIVALHVGSGQDILGRPGLLCFKQESVYRINDSASGSYTTVDGTVGAAGPLAVVGIGSQVFAVGKRGIYWWREDQLGMVNASDKVRPLWDPGQVDYTSLAKWCAGRWQGRAFFSIRRNGSTANDLAFEHDPDIGWLAPRSDAMACYATSVGPAETLYGGSPTNVGQAYQLNTGGTDDGNPIVGRLGTRWFEPNGGFQTNIWQIRVHGRGQGTLTVFRDFASTVGDDQPFDLDGTTVEYDTGLLYDNGVFYAEPVLEETESFFSLGLCRQFSLTFSFSTTTVHAAPKVLGTGTNPSAGAFAVYGLEWLYTPLGVS